MKGFKENKLVNSCIKKEIWECRSTVTESLERNYLLYLYIYTSVRICVEIIQVSPLEHPACSLYCRSSQGSSPYTTTVTTAKKTAVSMSSSDYMLLDRFLLFFFNLTINSTTFALTVNTCTATIFPLISLLLYFTWIFDI